MTKYDLFIYQHLGLISGALCLIPFIVWFFRYWRRLDRIVVRASKLLLTLGITMFAFLLLYELPTLYIQSKTNWIEDLVKQNKEENKLLYGVAFGDKENFFNNMKINYDDAKNVYTVKLYHTLPDTRITQKAKSGKKGVKAQALGVEFSLKIKNNKVVELIPKGEETKKVLKMQELLEDTGYKVNYDTLTYEVIDLGKEKLPIAVLKNEDGSVVNVGYLQSKDVPVAELTK